MPYTLRYKYTAGEVLRYEHTANLIVDLPGAPTPGEEDGEQLFGSSTFEQLQEVKSEKDGRWEIVSHQRLLSSDGDLAPPADMAEMEPQSFWMDHEGAAFQLENSAPLCPASLPVDPVDVGSRWNRSDPPMVTHCEVQSVEMLGEDRVVTMVTLATVPGRDADGDNLTEMKGVSRFSENRGCLLSSQTVITIEWKTGRKAVTILNIALQERRSSL